MKNSLALFKVLVASAGQFNFDHAPDGFVTDFNPTPEQLKLLKSTFKALPITTLFTVEERANAPVEHLIRKQILHYIEIYGLESPGLFNLECSNGKLATLTYVRAVTVAELEKLVHGLAYANRPIADVAPVVELIRDYKLSYDINLVLNNELKVALFDPMRDRFTSGDDAVRYICYQATTSALLIKSRKVLAEVAKNPIGTRFLENHKIPLAQVFNRHKRIILSCKNKHNASTINQISRLSKTKHVPLHEPIAKRFISAAIKDGSVPPFTNITLRDAFKYLNLIEYKLLGLAHDSFTIRNGKVWIESDRPVLNPKSLLTISAETTAFVKATLSHLKGKRILLDPSVDYGLPISRKQALGNLPYGTRVTATDPRKQLSAGIYWENQHNPGSYSHSTDLDLSAIDTSGNRTGWGCYAGYSKKNPITFSGDLTDATSGACEFMTINPSLENRYGLMVNIFRGPEPCAAQIVVGYPSSDKGKGAVWQDRTLIRESITLQSTQSIIGFLKDDSFIVYSGRLNNSHVSAGKHPVIDKALGKLWTLRDILDSSGISYDLVPTGVLPYDFDLRYAGFTIDKLETLLGI